MFDRPKDTLILNLYDNYCNACGAAQRDIYASQCERCEVVFRHVDSDYFRMWRMLERTRPFLFLAGLSLKDRNSEFAHLKGIKEVSSVVKKAQE